MRRGNRDAFGSFFPLNGGPSIDDDLHRHDPPWNKWDHPYSYDPFTAWGGPDKAANGSDWSDRLFQFDYEKTSRIGKEVFDGAGDMRWFGAGMSGEKAERFLRLWHDDPSIVLTRVIEYCNVSNGYPTWCLVYRHDVKASQNKASEQS